MAPKEDQQPPPQSKKRKDPPSIAPTKTKNKKQKVDHRARQRDARTLSTQATSKALQHGSLDVDKFVKARDFEIRALEEGMQRSKKALTKRAFQQVPRDLRRRTASHNAKRVPKRLRAKARKEMIQDQTPTANARTRKPTGRQRLREETVKKLRALGSRRKAEQNRSNLSEEQSSSWSIQGSNRAKTIDKPGSLQPRKARVKKRPTLATQPSPKAKFRKRQIHKSWLPTHVFHAKRAHITSPSSPLWRFAIPLTPTQKSYRPMHRANSERGAVAWDMSYMATIGIEGQQRSIEGILVALGITSNIKDSAYRKWIDGLRVAEHLLHKREAPHDLIAPATIVWQMVAHREELEIISTEREWKRKIFLRIHPSAFFSVWEEVVRLSRVIKPGVSVEDLRFEIGSIDVTGPGSTEALLGALSPWEHGVDTAGSRLEPMAAAYTEQVYARTFQMLKGLTKPTILPSGALLAFHIHDPRLDYPPRTIKLPNPEMGQRGLLASIAMWSPDRDAMSSSPLFDRRPRLEVSKLPSQKAINRRKAQTLPSQNRTILPADPAIPLILYVSPHRDPKLRTTWTLLVPWKWVHPIWYSIMSYPLSTGQQPRFAGLDQKRQLSFEAGQPWFPADFPGTQAGWEWEVMERAKRWDEWMRHPKSKRINWGKLDLGHGRKGEIGEGWSCHWELLFQAKEGEMAGKPKDGAKSTSEADNADVSAPCPAQSTTPAQPVCPEYPKDKPTLMAQIPFSKANEMLQSPEATISPSALVSVRLILQTRGVPQTCARIYRLPREQESRKAWLDLQPCKLHKQAKRQKTAFPRITDRTPSHLIHRRLAQTLLEPPQAGNDDYPACPDAEDLIGFVTTGNFNLAAGKGTGIGCLALNKAAQDFQCLAKEGRLCIVRNSGESVGRLATWELI